MLKKILLTFTLVLSGCYSSVKFNLNDQITEELPPEVALEYIKQHKNHYDSLINIRPENHTCIYNLETMSAGKTGQRPYSEFRLVTSEVSREVIWFQVLHGNTSSTFKNKTSCDYYFDRKIAIKAATALKSLGIKLE